MTQTHQQERTYRRLSAARRDILEAVHRINQQDTTPSGQAIRTLVEEMRGPTTDTTIYTGLDELATEGLVEKIPNAETNGTNHYHLTPDGRTVIQIARGDC